MAADLLSNLHKRLGEVGHADGLEEIAHHIIINGLLGIFKVVVAAQKGDVGHGTQLPHLPRQLQPRDKGHADVAQKKIRLELLHQLQGVQAVAGTAHQAKADVLPADHLAHGLPELRLVVGHHHGIAFFSFTRIPPASGRKRAESAVLPA